MNFIEKNTFSLNIFMRTDYILITQIISSDQKESH